MYKEATANASIQAVSIGFYTRDLCIGFALSRHKTVFKRQRIQIAARDAISLVYFVVLLLFRILLQFVLFSIRCGRCSVRLGRIFSFFHPVSPHLNRFALEAKQLANVIVWSALH